MCKIVYIVLTTYVIGSQQTNTPSGELFSFDSLLKTLVHPGDTYISCVVNRNNRSECFYEGVGTVGEILSTDGSRFYAKLENYHRFEHKVSLSLPNGTYVEHLGREGSSLNPYNSTRSVRSLKQEAFDYILKAGGSQIAVAPPSSADCAKLEGMLKNAIRTYFVEEKQASIFDVESISRKLGHAISVLNPKDSNTYTPSSSISSKENATSPNSDTSSEEVILLRNNLQQCENQLKSAQSTNSLLEEKLTDTNNQLAELQNALEAANIQQKATRNTLDTTVKHANIINQEYAELLQRHKIEVIRRSQAEEEMNALKQAQACWIATGNQKDAELASLREQVSAADSRSEVLQTALDESLAREKMLMQEHHDLSMRHKSEVLYRAQAEETLDAMKQAQESWIVTDNQKDTELASLREQVATADSRLESLQTALDKSLAREKMLQQEHHDLSMRHESEVLCRTQTEAALDALKQAQESWIVADSQKDAELASLREQVATADSRCEVLQTTLDDSAAREKMLMQKCAALTLRHNSLQTENAQLKSESVDLRDKLGHMEHQHAALQATFDTFSTQTTLLQKEHSALSQKHTAEIQRRAQVEEEIAALKKNLEQVVNTSIEIENQQNQTICTLEQDLLTLQNENEKLHLALREYEYRTQGVCQHCGGTFAGLFRKKCSVCGIIKDY